MYLKIKKIKGIEYAYLVTQKYNKKTKKRKQKNNAFLGKVLQVDKTANLDLNDYLTISKEEFIDTNPVRSIFKKLIELELFNHGFVFDEKQQLFVKDNLLVTAGCCKFKDSYNQSKFCLEINQGFLSARSLDRLCEPLPKLLDDMARANLLAKKLKSEGLDPPPELFINIFKKMN